MRVLVFRHVPFEGLGLIEPALAGRQIAVDFADLYQAGSALPDVAAYAALIFMGGPMSVNDDLPYLRQEMEAIRQAVERTQPILGICLGAQLVARALGAAVRRNDTREIGWYDLEFTEAATEDKLFGGLGRETVFHWHGETFDLPPGAELLASSELCRNQAYRLGTCVYGLQFHLEVTPAMIAEWCVQDENSDDVHELEGPIDPSLHAPRMAELSARVFGRWCEMIQLFAQTGEEKLVAFADSAHPTCPACGWHNTRASHTKSWLDSVLRMFSLRAFRCRTCGNRFRVVRPSPKE